MREQLSQNRLTYSAMGGKCYGFTKPCDDMEHLQLVADKLGALEDNEEELGIELSVLSKALKEGIYFKYYNEGIIHYSNDIEKISPTFEIKYELCCNFQGLIIISEEQKDDGGWLKIDNNVWHLKYSDYGKTWALTREELICKKD